MLSFVFFFLVFAQFVLEAVDQGDQLASMMFSLTPTVPRRRFHPGFR